ncbi:hypothetical protein [Sorangium sp. So ce1097]|uniref:hypothetical protein n=1 Tax=Sorangium sp. So ce1097 TaxID=3133330 RepID=UPI003F5D9E57
MTDREPADDAARTAPAEPEPGAPPDAQAEAPPPRRTKKRAKRRDAGGGEPGQPRDPELARLVEAFERGDYAFVRAGAGRLAKEAERDEVRRAARDLLRRIEPDPLAVALLVAAVALLAFLSLWYWSHSHASP